MTAFLEFWGSGSRRMQSLTPSARVACGLIVFISCLFAPLHQPLGMALVCGAVVGWVWLCGVPRKNLVGLLLYAGILFLPLFLLTPWVPPPHTASSHWFGAVRVPLEIGIRGTGCIFICAATIATLDFAELGTALGGLPVPRTMAILIMQIVHQTAMLTNETGRISSALRIRGLPSRLTMRLRVLGAFPAIWVLRIMNRAERVAVAMDLRGFEVTVRTTPAAVSILDVLAVTTTILLLGASITARWADGL